MCQQKIRQSDQVKIETLNDSKTALNKQPFRVVKQRVPTINIQPLTRVTATTPISITMYKIFWTTISSSSSHRVLIATLQN